MRGPAINERCTERATPNGGIAFIKEARGASRPVRRREDTTTEPLSEALRLLRRQSELEDAMRRRGGIRVVGERETYALREQLKHYPAAVRAFLDTASRLYRPVETLSPRDIEAGQ